MKVTHYKDIELKEEKTAKGAGIRWLITHRDGETDMAMRVIEIAPGGNTPEHNHPWEHQVFVIKGQGRVTAAGETKEFGPGSAIFVPSGVDHSFRNDSGETMEFVCMIPGHAARTLLQ